MSQTFSYRSRIPIYSFFPPEWDACTHFPMPVHIVDTSTRCSYERGPCFLAHYPEIDNSDGDRCIIVRSSRISFLSTSVSLPHYHHVMPSISLDITHTHTGLMVVACLWLCLHSSERERERQRERRRKKMKGRERLRICPSFVPEPIEERLHPQCVDAKV